MKYSINEWMKDSSVCFKNYHITLLEGLSIVWTSQRFRTTPFRFTLFLVNMRFAVTCFIQFRHFYSVKCLFLYHYNKIIKFKPESTLILYHLCFFNACTMSQNEEPTFEIAFVMFNLCVVICLRLTSNPCTILTTRNSDKYFQGKVFSLGNYILNFDQNSDVVGCMQVCPLNCQN